MRVLVTGGAGFIGSHVVQQALEAGLDVAVLDNFSSGKRTRVPAGVRIFEADLRDRSATARALSAFAPQLVSHQAAQISVVASLNEPLVDAEINVMGGLNLLEACASSRVRHVVFASSGGAIYGEVPAGQRADERASTDPRTPYGIHKLAFERLLDVYRESRGISSSVLRYANVYGPRQAARGEAGVVAVFFARALSGQPLSVYGQKSPGDGGCVRDYVFVGDVARANVAALTGALPEPLLNVGSGRATSTEALARLVGEVCERPVSLSHASPRHGDVERSLLDVTRLEAALGPATPLESGLRQSAAWYRAS